MNDTTRDAECRAYKTEEVAVITSLSPSNMDEGARAGRFDATLRPFRSGRTWVWPRAYVDAMFPPASTATENVSSATGIREVA
jgi:hypothetical protein